MNNGFRQRIKRIKKHLVQCGYTQRASDETRAALLVKLNQVQEARRALRRRVIVTKSVWSSKASTRHFFRRICTKIGDNTIPTLVSRVQGSQVERHDKPNLLAESWESIFNGKIAAPESIPAYVDRLAKRWGESDLADIDTAFTETEVEAAIKRCKRGKACGPDELGNEWYRDNMSDLVPILTKLFNICMTEAQHRRPLMKRTSLVLARGGDTSNPLNYRPIALLNTDYKIFTRILAWRVRRHITKLVHENQSGFIPGRNIHANIDLYEAAKIVCSSNEGLEQAQVLMLDFAKAYTTHWIEPS